MDPPFIPSSTYASPGPPVWTTTFDGDVAPSHTGLDFGPRDRGVFEQWRWTSRRSDRRHLQAFRWHHRNPGGIPRQAGGDELLLLDLHPVSDRDASVREGPSTAGRPGDVPRHQCPGHRGGWPGLREDGRHHLGLGTGPGREDSPGSAEGHQPAGYRLARPNRQGGVREGGSAQRRGAHRSAPRSPADPVIDVDLALAFTTGMVATVNPCGFAMLPAYLSFFLGVEQDRGSISRARVVGPARAAGCVATFAVIGLVVSRVTRSVYDVAPWVSLVIGGALILVGVLMLRGFDPSVRLPRLDKGGRSGGLRSMTVFGVSYAVASIGCELPVFLVAMSGAFGKNLVTGAVYFVFFGLGFAAILVTLTITLALARQSLVTTMRRVLPYVNRIAGGLLVLAGAYVAWYGWLEIRKDSNDATVKRVTDWSFTAGDWLRDNRDLIVMVFALLV